MRGAERVDPEHYGGAIAERGRRLERNEERATWKEVFELHDGKGAALELEGVRHAPRFDDQDGPELRSREWARACNAESGSRRRLYLQRARRAKERDST